ncbi:MAG: ArnT family glycosyltransferase [Pirellulaceae bacterium]
MRYAVLILTACSVMFFVGLGSTRLWDEDEGFFASTAAEMHAQGDWVVPTFNERLFGHKPPWMYWLMMVGYQLFGVNELGARFFSAVAGTATALLTYRLGARLFNPRVGFLAGLALGSSLMFSVVARAATPDSHLVFFSTLALYIFATHGFARAESAPTLNAGVAALLPVRWSSFILMYAVMGCGALTKGPIGVLFPMAVIGMFLLCLTPRRATAPGAAFWRRMAEGLRPFGPRNFLGTVWRMRPLTAAVVVLVVAGPWYYAVGVRTEGEFLRQFFGVHHFQRFSSAMESHSGPLYYYVVSVLVGMFPWSVFSLPTLLLWYRDLRDRCQHYSALVFLTCWVGVYLGIFSLARTKLPNYVLPAYPALAVLFAYFLDHCLRDPAPAHRSWLRIALGVLVAVGVGVVVILPVGGTWQIAGQTLLDRAGLMKDVQRNLFDVGLVGLIAVVGGLAAMVLVQRRRLDRAVDVVCLTAVVLMVGIWTYAAPRIDRFQNPQNMAQQIRAASAGGPCRVASFDYFRPSLVFYCASRIERCEDVNDVCEFFAAGDVGYVLTVPSRLPALLAVLPPDVEIVDRQSRFPGTGELVLLAKGVHTAGAAQPNQRR